MNFSFVILFFVVIRVQGLFYWRTEVNVTNPQPSFFSFKSIIENPNTRVNILNFVFINFKVLHADLLPLKIYSSIISNLKPDLPYIYLNISHADYLGRQHCNSCMYYCTF